MGKSKSAGQSLAILGMLFAYAVLAFGPTVFIVWVIWHFVSKYW